MLHIYNLKELHYHTKSVHWNSPLPAGLVKGLLDALEAFTAFQPGLDFSRLTGRRQAHHRPPGHSICKNTTTGTTCQLWKSHSWQSIRLMCFRYYAILYQFKWLWNEFAFRYPSRAKNNLGKTKILLTAIARQPLFVLATRQPSVVAMGTWNCFSSNNRGPATPTGTGM